MGTRHATIAIDKKGKTKVGQYGQWDGYPEGQGVDILSFLTSKKDGKTGVDRLEASLSKVRFATKKDEKEVDEFLKSIGCEVGWMNGEQAEKYKTAYPYASRDIGGDILELIVNSEDAEIVLNDNSNFVTDSVSCEFAYVVDFKKRTLEVFKGYIDEPLTQKDRFYRVGKEPGAVKLLKEFSLDNLPNEDDFLAACKENEIEEEEY